MSTGPQRHDDLELGDAELLRRCELTTYRASGPGGQKRNKTDSAVRLRHEPSGLMVIAAESRSQHENRARALRRLRERMAAEVREPVGLDDYAVPPALAVLLPGSGRPRPYSVRELGMLHRGIAATNAVTGR